MQKANRDHRAEKCIELQMYEGIYLLEKTSCILLFQILTLLFAYTCASWFPAVLEISVFLGCAELRIIFEVQLVKNN